MVVMHRRKLAIFFIVFGICLVALAVTLNVGWILLNLQEIALMVLGIVFFAIIITGLVLNTIFLVREIRRNEQHDAFINAVTHELKTPIASIRLYLETLQTRDVDERQRREFYSLMLADSDRLLHTVEQVLRAGQSGGGEPSRRQRAPAARRRTGFARRAERRRGTLQAQERAYHRPRRNRARVSRTRTHALP